LDIQGSKAARRRQLDVNVDDMINRYANGTPNVALFARKFPAPPKGLGSRKPSSPPEIDGDSKTTGSDEKQDDEASVAESEAPQPSIASSRWDVFNAVRLAGTMFKRTSGRTKDERECG
jgi:hypothetical protein